MLHSDLCGDKGEVVNLGQQPGSVVFGHQCDDDFWYTWNSPGRRSWSARSIRYFFDINTLCSVEIGERLWVMELGKHYLNRQRGSLCADLGHLCGSGFWNPKGEWRSPPSPLTEGLAEYFDDIDRVCYREIGSQL